MENKEMTDLIQGAVDELHKAVERQDDEIKKFGEPMADTKADIEKLSLAVQELDTKFQRSALPSAEAPPDPGVESKAHAVAFNEWARTGKSEAIDQLVKSAGPSERKALVEDATGLYLVTPEIDADIERTVAAETVIRALATKRTINKDSLQLRSITEATVAFGKLETGEDPAESTPTPGAPTYQYAEVINGLVKIGKDELEDSDYNLVAFLGDSFGRAVAELEDLKFIKGAGHASEEPEGITINGTYLAATLDVTTSATAMVEDFKRLIYEVPTKYRRKGVFVVNSTTELAIYQLRAVDGSGTEFGPFLWQPSIIAGKPNTFIGYPMYTQDDMDELLGAAAVIAIFGDVKAGYRVIDRRGISIQRLTELYAEAGQVGFLLHKRVGGGAIKPANKALALLSDKA